MQDLLRRMEGARKKVKAAEAKAKKAQEMAAAESAGGEKRGETSKKGESNVELKESKAKELGPAKDEAKDNDDDDDAGGDDTSSVTAAEAAALAKKKKEKQQEKEKRRLEALKRKKQRRKEEEEKGGGAATAGAAALAAGGRALVLKADGNLNSRLSTSLTPSSSSSSPPLMACPVAWQFLGLDPLLGAAMAKLGFEKGPTPVQTAVLPRALGTVNEYKERRVLR